MVALEEYCCRLLLRNAVVSSTNDYDRRLVPQIFIYLRLTATNLGRRFFVIIQLLNYDKHITYEFSICNSLMRGGRVLMGALQFDREASRGALSMNIFCLHKNRATYV